MENLRRLGGGGGILAAIAAAWLAIGMTVVLPAAGLSLKAQHDPNKYLPFIAKHQVLFWSIDVLGGLLASLAAVVLLLALADRFREEARDQAQLALAMGVAGAIGFAIVAFLKLIGLGYLAALYGASSKQGAAIAFYAVNGTASSFLALGDVALGLSALIFGSVMLRTSEYARVGFLSVVTGTPLILLAFVPNDILFIIASGLTSVWLAWTGALLWAETVPSDEAARSMRSGRVGMSGHFKERRAV